MRKHKLQSPVGRIRVALLIAAVLLLVGPGLTGQALQTAGQVVVHANASVNLSTTAWTELPGAKGAVTLPTGGDLAIVFTAEALLTGTSNATLHMRAVVDGQVVSPIVRKMFVGTIGMRTNTVTYFVPGLAAGPHQVRMEAATTSGDTCWFGGRTLVLRFARPDSGDLRMAGVEGTSTTRNAGSWSDMPGLTATIDCPWEARLTIHVSGEFVPLSAGKRVFLRAVVDGAYVAAPTDMVIAVGPAGGNRSFTFHLGKLSKAKHTAKIQWSAESSAMVLFPTLALTAFPEATHGHVAHLCQVAPSGAGKANQSPSYVPVPDLGGTIAVTSRSDLTIRFSAETALGSKGSCYLRALVDGKPANDVSYQLVDNQTGTMESNECVFVVRDVERGFHEVRLEWASLTGSTIYLGDRVLTVSAVRGQRPLLVTAMESTRPVNYTYGGQFASSVVEVKNAKRVFRGYVADMFYRARPGVADWFLENSRNQMQVVEAGVIGPGLKKYDERYYRENVKDPFTQMKLEALQNADKQFDFSYYDRDGDGKVESDELWALVIFYQDTNHGEVRSIPTLVSNDGVTLDYSGGIATVYTPDFKTNRQIGVTNHELCHLFLKAGDMYENGDPTAPGPYSIMDQHGWNAHLDGMHKLILGKWEDPYVVSGDGYRILPAITRGGVIMKLQDPASHKGEYWLVENRQKHGYNASLPADGLAIFHCDESRLPNWRTALEIEPCGGPAYNYANYLFKGKERGFHPDNDIWHGSPKRDTRWHDSTPSNIGIWAVRRISEVGDIRAFYDLPGPGILVENEAEDIKALFETTKIRIRLVNTHTAKATFQVKVAANSAASWTNRYETLNGYEQRVIEVEVAPVAAGYMGTVKVTALSTTNSAVRCEDETRIHYTLRASGGACPGCVVSLQLHDPIEAGKNYEMRASLGSEPGFVVGGLGVVPLALDNLFFATPHLVRIFQKFRGSFDGQGEARAYVAVPNDARLKGISIHVAYVTYDTALRNVSNAVGLSIQ